MHCSLAPRGRGLGRGGKPLHKAAFTLAEVLITLGIIGVVAAMTLPTLIEQHEKKATAVKLEKFYTVMNQAVLRWRSEDGIEGDDYELPEEIVNNAEKTKAWYDEKLKPYIKDGTSGVSGKYFSSKFDDGSGFIAYVNYSNVMHFFYCTKFKYCAPESYDGRKTFLFTLVNGHFVTSMWVDIVDRTFLLNSCKNPSTGDYSKRHYCTRLIQVDGWEIKSDYPW